MSDINQLLSLLKDHSLILPEVSQPSSSSANTVTAPTTMLLPQQQQEITSAHTSPSITLPGSLPMNFNLSNISQDVIDQVRAEYQRQSRPENSTSNKQQQQQQQQEDEALKNATSVTSEVLVKLGSLMKETNLLQVLEECKRRQDQKEKALFAERQAIEMRYKKQKDAILTKEMLGVKVDPRELKQLEQEKMDELHMMDLRVLKEMDKEVTYLQQEFVRLNVPLFKVTQDPRALKLQQKVLSILQDTSV